MVPFLVEPIVRAALAEDLGRAGDITSDAILPPGKCVTALIVARQAGVLAGLDVALLAFRLLEPALYSEGHAEDGDRVEAGQTVARINGRARAILAAERT